MNDFINGIFRIWEKLPDQSKDAFTKQLGFRERSALHVGSQLLKYYVDLSNQEPITPNPAEQDQQPKQRQRNIPKRTKEKIENDVFEYEYDESTNSYIEKKTSSSYTQKATQDEDDDIIDAEWTEKPMQSKPIVNVQKPKATRKRKK